MAFLLFIALLSVYRVISSFVRFIALVIVMRFIALTAAVRFLALIVVMHFLVLVVVMPFLALVAAMRFIALVIAVRFVALVIVVRFIAFIDAARFIAFCIVVSSVCVYYCSIFNNLVLIELLLCIFIDIFSMDLRFILLFTCLEPLCSASVFMMKSWPIFFLAPVFPGAP